MNNSKLSVGVWLMLAIYLSLVALGFYFLSTSQTAGVLLSPWQTIHPAYIYVFATATLILGFLIFSKIRLSILLLFFILHSLLLHSYLPLTHELLYGADGWRHIANEERMLQNLPFKNAELINSGSGGISTLLGQLSYSQLWGLTTIIARISGLDLIVINKWLIPIIWSFAFPLLLYYLGRSLGWDGKKSFFLVWLSSLPFALQSAGSFTLPVNLGFLVWLLATIFLFKHLAFPSKRSRLTLLAFSILLFFGYNLFWLLFLIMWGVGETLVKYKVQSTKYKVAILIVLVAWCLPGIELIAGYSYFMKIHLLAGFKQLIGNFTAIYLASGPRPHDIAIGNIIFNQTPSYAFVVNAFTAWRWWLMLFMIVFWTVVVMGLRNFFRQRTPVFYLLSFITLSFTAAYIISRYFLTGEQILTRRLDVVLALLFIILFTEGLYSAGERTPKKFVVPISLFVITIAMAASYSLGPDTRAVSLDEYRAMEFVWNQERGESRHCVLSDTYPLLSLEAISKKEIIGGGFPISATFGQPERERLLKNVLSEPSPEVWQKVFDIMKTNSCWLVAPKSALAYNTLEKAKADNLLEFGSVVVWKLR